MLDLGVEFAMNALWLDLGLLDYQPAFSIQEQVLAARVAGDLPAAIILQENPPTITIGRSGSHANVLVNAAELERRGVEMLEVNRGGDVTYHGPGQIIASPLLYLGDLHLNANQYLHRLEDLLIILLDAYGITAGKKEAAPGVWVGEAKIAAVGIAVRHGYTFHGFSINVNLDLEPFGWIHPCGMAHMSVTSMKQILGGELGMSEVKDQLRRVLSQGFDMQIQDADWPEVQALAARQAGD
jgi:lipoate-protein ligase B